jgi:hypothetical protein
MPMSGNDLDILIGAGQTVVRTTVTDTTRCAAELAEHHRNEDANSASGAVQRHAAVGGAHTGQPGAQPVPSLGKPLGNLRVGAGQKRLAPVHPHCCRILLSIRRRTAGFASSTALAARVTATRPRFAARGRARDGYRWR